MNKTRLFPSLILIAVFLAACASPATSGTGKAPPSHTSDAAVQRTAAASPYPLATSRGPNLEATDPATVKLASGGLELVEFFRFT